MVTFAWHEPSGLLCCCRHGLDWLCHSCGEQSVHACCAVMGFHQRCVMLCSHAYGAGLGMSVYCGNLLLPLCCAQKHAYGAGLGLSVNCGNPLLLLCCAQRLVHCSYGAGAVWLWKAYVYAAVYAGVV